MSIDNPKELERLKFRTVWFQKRSFSCLLSILRHHPPNIYLQVKSLPVFNTLLGFYFTLKNFSGPPIQNNPSFVWALVLLCSSLITLCMDQMPSPSSKLKTLGGWRTWGMLEEVSSDNNIACCIYLQKWLFVTDLCKKPSHRTRCTSPVFTCM